MNEFTLFQRNNLISGTRLAGEIQSSAPHLRAFVSVGSYVQTPHGAARPSKSLNIDKSNLRFVLRKYEVDKQKIGIDIIDEDLVDSIYINDIKSIEQLEDIVRDYLQNFSVLDVAWKSDAPF